MTQSGSGVTNIGKFYQQIEDFKGKIIRILGQFGKNSEIVELNKYYEKLLQVKKVNVRLPIEYLYDNGITKFAKEILMRDESFFLGKVSQIADTNADTVTVTQQDVFFIAQVRQVWGDLHPNVKINIWKYVQVICILAETITGGHILATTREELINNGQLKSDS